jgi:hypothetical protein
MFGIPHPPLLLDRLNRLVDLFFVVFLYVRLFLDLPNIEGKENIFNIIYYSKKIFLS